MKHLTGLAHIALFTEDLENSIRFYEKLGGVCTDRADIKKAAGTNHLAMVKIAGFYLEIIEPHDGSPVTPEGGLFPHLALEVDDIDGAVQDLKDAGITGFRTEVPNDMPSLFGGIRNTFFAGPNGEQLELLQKMG